MASGEPAVTELTADDIRIALRRRYRAPEHAIAFEVAQSTGFDANRHLDAIAMDLWPSRGLALAGIEIKISRRDWRRELENPWKAEQLARFCDYFWVAAPTGMIGLADFPSAWGLMEVDPDGVIKTAKPAAKTEAEAVGRPFLAAMMRASAREIAPTEAEAQLAKRRAELEAEFDERLKSRVQWQRNVDQYDAEQWRGLCKALGEDPKQAAFFLSNEAILATAKALLASGIMRAHDGLKLMVETLRDALPKLERAATDLAIEIPLPKPKKVPRGKDPARSDGAGSRSDAGGAAKPAAPAEVQEAGARNAARDGAGG